MLNKLYTRIEWENFPSEKTALNESNLNRMDLALDNMDNRVIEMYSTKVNVEVANKLIKNWTMDEATGVITIEKLNGEKIIFDLNIEKIPVDFKLSEDGILTMTTDDGTQFTANIGAMIPILTFEDSDTIVVSVEGTGVNKTYSFSIKSGSVTEEKLQPNFLADVKTEVAKAQASKESAAQSASDASSSASAAAISESNAKTSETASSESASAAKESETNAGESATNAASSAQSASDSAGNSLTYANSANESAVTASEKAAESLESATSASDSATSASISASSASNSATAASDSAILAESYTHGGTGAREGEDTDNARYYMEQAKAVSKVDIATKDLAGISKPGEGLEIVPDGTMNVSDKIVQHPGKTINSEEGVHGLREWNGKLEYFDGKDWIEIKTGGSSIGVGDVVGASIVASSRQATLKWTDPDDIEVSGATIAAWAGTKLIRKEGSAPESVADGVAVIDNTEKNQYSSDGFTDTDLTNGTTYYYRFFPYTTEGVVTDGTSLNATPERIVIATVPSQSGTLTFNGSVQEPLFSDYNSDQMAISGDINGTNAGTYTATFTPTIDYCWPDGSYDAKDVSWTIEKANGSITLSSEAVELSPTNTTSTVTASDATGEVTVTSNDTSVATASISDNTITIESVNNTSGSTAITVSVSPSTNYNATSKTISVTAAFVLDGETATPINDIQTWLKCDSTGRAMQQGSDITTLTEVIANSDILGYLMSDESAMQYLTRSTGFAEEGCASETFMTALGASSWVDETILNSDIWVSKIQMSPYWDKVSNIAVTLHGGALETITITGLYGSPTVTTNSDGNVSYQLPVGTFTFSGSVSGQSFERTVAKDTTDVYVMPEGAVYWYGNAVKNIILGLTPNSKSKGGIANFNTNNIYLLNSTSGGLVASNSLVAYLYTTDMIDLSMYNKLKIKYSSDKSYVNGFSTMLADIDLSDYPGNIQYDNGTDDNTSLPHSYLGVSGNRFLWHSNTQNVSNHVEEIDVSDLSDSAYLSIENGDWGNSGYGFNMTIYEIWFV